MRRPLLLILDNHDSFTFNLATVFEKSFDRVEVVRSDSLGAADVRALEPSAVVISPGPGSPADAGCSIDVVRLLSGLVPILGVCMGHQAIGAAFGARVVRAPSTMHGKTSDITHDGRGLFDGAPSPFSATRYHSLAIDEASMPDELRVTARSGDGLMMALEHRSHPTFGVQFHPESVLTDAGPRLLANFSAIALAADRSGVR